jgi:hypothetical protein
MWVMTFMGMLSSIGIAYYRSRVNKRGLEILHTAKEKEKIVSGILGSSMTGVAITAMILCHPVWALLWLYVFTYPPTVSP